MSEQFSGVQLQSTLDRSGMLKVELVDMTLPAPRPDEVIVRMKAAPINPSDLAMLFGPADLESLQAAGSDERPALIARVPDQMMELIKSRVDLPITPGNEGTGTIVAAGVNARHLIGRRVGLAGGGMYTEYRCLPYQDCIVLPEDATPADGASIFINPLTALCFVETMKMEGHRGIVHLAAASNLGQMLNRICIKDEVPLINIVRTPEQVSLLRKAGASHVLDRSSPGFEDELADALHETGATLAFDPIGGGRQASQVLHAMEKSAARGIAGYNRYGTDVFKQLYIYGTLDFSPTMLDRWVGFAWSVGGWLLSYRLRQIGPGGVARLQARVVSELKTTFASHYTATLSLREALRPENVRAYSRKATGEKYLLSLHDGIL